MAPGKMGQHVHMLDIYLVADSSGGKTFATLMFTKVSICLFLLRIAITTATVRPLQAAVVILILSNVALSLAWILQCTPHLDKAWNEKLPGKCFSKGQLERIIIAQALISIISDFFLSAFPIIILRKVQIGFRDKVGLCLLMSLGVVTGSISIARTVLNGQNLAYDPSWDTLPNWYLRSWEVFFGIVAACIPTLRPGYKWLRAKLRNRFVQLGNGQTKPATAQVTPATPPQKWTPPKPSAYLGLRNLSKLTTGLLTTSTGKSTTGKSTTGTWTVGKSTTPSQASDVLPLQNFDEPSVRADIERYPASDQEPSHYPRDDSGHERREALHIPGDLSTHRPGHLKRLDSEAKVGGGLGAEEVEERI
ncbi:MAG: hypothetical protein Q9211_001819 [Gyalolechia sp. 1 TL-2023]